MTVQGGWDDEQKWLAYVLDTVEQRLAEARQIVGDYSGKAREERRTLWEEGAHSLNSSENWIELAQATTHMGQMERNVAFYRHQTKRLERMLSSPYFGRIDFHENGRESADRIFIGISGLHDATSGDLIVYDWRAPISSLYYDAELGPAKYECRDGVVSGKVLLKRQYRIVHGKLEFMFDTDLKIDDDVLQEILARNIDEKMRSIVTSIQREQNRVIRDHKHNLLLVQGPAGSGKTAIALHRAAFLLYNNRDSMNASNIVIFSPNQVFSDYISAVLPELGEENIVQTTFHEYAEKYLGEQVTVETMYSQLEHMLATPVSAERDVRTLAISFKASGRFMEILNRYIEYLESGKAFHFFTVSINDQVIISRDEMAQLFDKHRDLPLAKRLEKLRQRVLFLLGPMEEERLKQLREELKAGPEHMMEWEVRQESKRRLRAEFDPIRSKVGSWASFDVFTAYYRLFESRHLFSEMAGRNGVPAEWQAIRRHTISTLSSHYIPYEDASPLLYLKRKLEGTPVLQDVRHVIVDEAQDYAPIQYELINLVFPRASLTVLGDLNQTVHPYMHINSYDDALAALKRDKSTLVKLTKSYRSTRQIMEFARAILADPDPVDVVRREGTRPQVIKMSSGRETIAAIEQDICELQGKGMATVAVLCKTAAQSRQLHQQLRRGLDQKVDVLLITSGDENFRTGVVVIPVYLAKGLEFDAVIIADADAGNYGDERHRGLFYVACTRALHELHLYYTDTVSPFIASADSTLYEVASTSAAGSGRPI